MSTRRERLKEKNERVVVFVRGFKARKEKMERNGRNGQKGLSIKAVYVSGKRMDENNYLNCTG